MENGTTLQSQYRSSSIQPNILFISLRVPRVLSHILLHLEWTDFYSLSNSCRHCRLLFEDMSSRDTILSRFVPWYAHAMRLRNPFHGYKDVPISLKDLDLLLTSQRVPLHQYPLHARRALASSHSTDGVTSWLESLTHAHSRFVLLLQAYVHSSNDALQAELEEAIWSWPESSDQLRKLTFPAPLLYCSHESPQLPGPEKRRGSKNRTWNGRNVRSPMTSSPHRPDESARLTSATLPSKRSRSLPFLSRTSTATKSWRRLSTISHFSSETDYMSGEGVSANSSHQLVQQVIPKDFSTDSFLYPGSGSNSSPLSGSRNSLSPFTGRSSSTGSTTGSTSTGTRSFGPHLQPATRHPFTSGYTSHPIRMTSPFDLSFAVSRARAPILRVFVPYSDDQDASQEPLLCEQQLIDAGLWDHLSAGDLVCNLGYVPPIEDDDMGAPVSYDSDLTTVHRRREPGRKSDSHQKSQNYPFAHYHGRPTHSRKWLLYNGQFLVPHKPPGAISLPDPLALPTPFYYMHIMPPYTNPIYVIDDLGLGDISALQLEMHLVHTTKKVRSPHSPAGRALVRKYAWIAHVSRSRVFLDRGIGQELQSTGDGWVGEWILEGEGTKEGKEILFNCVLGKVTEPMEWEVVVERCGGGRIWLRYPHRYLNFGK
ncbi:hypothetical protein AX15_004155 [Amanita polypyramis BW_CC]|nr:hypothetical protein AX15_004155 [Amanita polypyramis BW_CC]